MARPPSLLKPTALKPQDVVRIVAPASPFDPAALERGAEVLEAWGLRIRMRDDIHAAEHYLAGSPRRRAEELAEAFSDVEARAILAVRGGYGLTTILPLLEPELIRANPKIVCGCSDLTALLNWLVQEAGMTALHGPMVGALGKETDVLGTARLKALLHSSEPPPELCSALPDAYSWCIAPGVATGRSVGGSLSLLAATCGTPAQVDTTDSVLFLEDVGERPYRIDRLLVQLLQAGLLHKASAVVFGDMVGCDDQGGSSWRDAVDRVFRDLAVPVLLGLPFGHAEPNLALPLGVRVTVDAGAGTVVFREAPFV